MEFGEMKRNTSNWSNFCMLLRRAGLTASAGLSCITTLSSKTQHCCYYQCYIVQMCDISNFVQISSVLAQRSTAPTRLLSSRPGKGPVVWYPCKCRHHKWPAHTAHTMTIWKR